MASQKALLKFLSVTAFVSMSAAGAFAEVLSHEELSFENSGLQTAVSCSEVTACRTTVDDKMGEIVVNFQSLTMYLTQAGATSRVDSAFVPLLNDALKADILKLTIEDANKLLSAIHQAQTTNYDDLNRELTTYHQAGDSTRVADAAHKLQVLLSQGFQRLTSMITKALASPATLQVNVDANGKVDTNVPSPTPVALSATVAPSASPEAASTETSTSSAVPSATVVPSASPEAVSAEASTSSAVPSATAAPSVSPEATHAFTDDLIVAAGAQAATGETPLQRKARLSDIGKSPVVAAVEDTSASGEDNTVTLSDTPVLTNLQEPIAGETPLQRKARLSGIGQSPAPVRK